MISVRSLSKRHGAREVLVGVTAQVDKGETIAIVGPSGGGKSTLLRCLNYLEGFHAGEVEIAGVTLFPGMASGDPALRRLRTRVGMVFQQFNLFPHLTAIDNITLAPRVVKRTPVAAAEAKARALAQEPDVMLFDEPTSALDPEMRDDVMEVIRGLAQGGMTMLVVTHEMQFAHDIATRVWVIDRGTIAEDGPPSKVVDQPETAVAREFFSRLRRTSR